MIEHEEGGFMRSDKITVHLAPVTQAEAFLNRPQQSSSSSHIKLSFRSGGQSEVFRWLRSAVEAKGWVKKAPEARAKAVAKKEFRSGISGIEKKISQKESLV